MTFKVRAQATVKFIKANENYDFRVAFRTLFQDSKAFLVAAFSSLRFISPSSFLRNAIC